ncbi:Protein kinase-like domain protein [Niveomyces insectorum RCEF 264]|uniref:Protein kinase-like domain protein n=1 Tax=Niveomyces insectorum RCEF 264 TaxID=1081102 RepID=A0A167XXY4_9HYPO|nr:Protein kinase-like domain protein [Niveomyces insectorum RCEF 264]
MKFVSIRPLFLFCLGIAGACTESAGFEHGVDDFTRSPIVRAEQTFVDHRCLSPTLNDDGKNMSFNHVFFGPAILPAGVEHGHTFEANRSIATGNFATTDKTMCLDRTCGWRPRKTEYREFAVMESLQPNRMEVLTHPDFDAPVLVKMARLARDAASLEHEVAMYRLLYGSGITPEFLGYVAEDGRTIGFIMEYIRGGNSTTRNRNNMQGCLAALRRLHQRGIAHGDAHDGNCLLREDGSAVLVDFELSMETRSPSEFERDLDIMDRCIRTLP